MSNRTLPTIQVETEPGWLVKPDDAFVQRGLPPRVREYWNAVKDVKDVLVQGTERSNTIDIFGTIGADVRLNYIRSVLRRIGNRTTVFLDINSGGGSFWESIAIYNELVEHNGRVVARVRGLAGSGAQLITMAADEVIMGEGSFQFIHNSWSIVIGNRHDLIEAAALAEKIDRQMINIISARSGKGADEVEALLDADTFLTADESLDFGLAEQIIRKERKKTAKNDDDKADSDEESASVNQPEPVVANSEQVDYNPTEVSNLLNSMGQLRRTITGN